jgi:hypothetical protein
MGLKCNCCRGSMLENYVLRSMFFNPFKGEEWRLLGKLAS